MGKDKAKSVTGHGYAVITKNDGWDYHDHMLCPDCKFYMLKGIYGCHIATELLAFNLKYGTSSAIFECPAFKEKE